jgi:acyl-CoA synthetase (AMP-forming)/AMP-acid ligase II
MVLEDMQGNQVVAGESAEGCTRRVWHHSLSPTIWLPRAAGIEHDAIAIHHTSARGEVYQRTYRQFADAARGLAYFLKAHSLRRVGLVLPNTPGFLTSVFAISAAGGVSVAVNHRLHPKDIDYVLTHADVDCVIVDREFRRTLDVFHEHNPQVLLLEDADAGTAETSPFDSAIEEGWLYDQTHGATAWDGLQTSVEDESDAIALAYTSGTTARPKGVQLTHRGAYLAALANIVDGGLNSALPGTDRCRYLWTLPVRYTFMQRKRDLPSV